MFHEQLENRPLLRTGEILELVPGLVVTQHTGDGKANQLFLRGFNLDHGTDFLTRVEGMPVNMPAHGHGQGYMDLDFVIPVCSARGARRSSSGPRGRISMATTSAARRSRWTRSTA